MRKQKRKIMNVVNGFDIDTPEGATAYLESEGVDVEEYTRKGIDELKRHKALSLSDVSNNEPKGEVKVCECLNPQPYRGDNGKVMCFSCDGVYD